MKLIAVKCKTCGDVIYSRANHDFRRCTCGDTAIDGGQSGHYRIGGSNWEHADLDLDVTLKDLYIDWNTNANKLGLIKPSEVVKKKKVKRATKTKS